jgi:arginase
MSYALIGYACDLGGPHLGAAHGPKVLREQGAVRCLEALGHKVVDLGDAIPAEFTGKNPQLSAGEGSMHNSRQIYQACFELYKKTTAALEIEHKPIILGGDHSAIIGSFAAVSDHYRKKGQKIGLIYIDAHSDINTWESSISRQTHGTTLAVLGGLAPGALASLQSFSPALDFSNLALLGIRDVEPQERKIISENKIQAFSIKEVDRYGMGACVERAIEIASKDTAGFFVSFDLDVCEPNLVPATPLQIRGGLSFRESHLALEMLYDSGKVLGFELSEFNPGLDTAHKTSDFSLSLLESIAGKSIL